MSRFLRALSDRYISVRVKACEAAGLLRSPAPDIVSKLYDCLAKDSSVKVRLSALKGTQARDAAPARDARSTLTSPPFCFAKRRTASGSARLFSTG